MSGKIDILDVKNFLEMRMADEWDNLPDGDADYESGKVVLGGLEYKSLIKYMAYEEILRYIEKNM